MVTKIKDTLKKYSITIHNYKKNIIQKNIEKVKMVVKKLNNQSMNCHPQHRIEKYESWDW